MTWLRAFAFSRRGQISQLEGRVPSTVLFRWMPLMPPGDAYRALADDFKKRAQREHDPEKRGVTEKLAAEYPS